MTLFFLIENCHLHILNSFVIVSFRSIGTSQFTIISKIPPFISIFDSFAAKRWIIEVITKLAK